MSDKHKDLTLKFKTSVHNNNVNNDKDELVILPWNVSVLADGH